VFNLAVVCALSGADFVAFAVRALVATPDLRASKYDALH